MKVTASLTDFDFDIIEGINGNDVPKKALSGVSRPSSPPPVLAKLTSRLRSGKTALVWEVESVAGEDIWSLQDSE